MQRSIARIGKALRRRATRLLPDERVVRSQYVKENGHAPDLITPRDLSEKLCWLKLNYCTPLQEQCADKLAVRSYVAETIGAEYLIPLIGTFDRASELRREAIANESFVLKVTHDSGGVMVVEDRGKHDWAEARAFFRRRLRQNYYYETRERVYRDVAPRILVEELLRPDEGPLLDYKFWCFHGRVELVQNAIIPSGSAKQRYHTYYDRDWRKLPVRRQYDPVPYDVPRPKLLDEMIAVAERLSAPFPFCRTDLYLIGDRIWFGELTFYPSGGHVKFRPDSEERRLGDLLTLPAPTQAPRGGLFGRRRPSAPGAPADQSGTAARAKSPGS